MDWIPQISQSADFLLLDSYYKGGTGMRSSEEVLHEAISTASPTPVFIAGGLNPDNVAKVLRVFGPYGVDVQSGVETGDRSGTKDPAKVRAFIQEVRTIMPSASP